MASESTASGGSGGGCSPASRQARPFDATKVDAPLKQTFSESADEQVAACEEILSLLSQAWETPVVGRDLAYELCDHIREERGLERLVELCTASSVEVQLASMAALEQCLTPANRDKLVRLQLDQFIRIVADAERQHPRMVKAALGILESLFKQSAHTCARLLDAGALSAVLYVCRSDDTRLQQHCAAALANCAMYGTAQTQRNMVQRDAAEWLFRLAFSSSPSVQYYACLAISILASNKELEAAIKASGTLELIAPFVSSHDPGEFARSDPAHCQGRSKDWLKRLAVVLRAGNKSAQCLAAFHFAMEANIKKEQGRVKIFQEIGAVEPLQNVALYGNRLSRQLAKSALELMGHELPKHLSLELLSWTQADVRQWLTDISLEQYADGFEAAMVDGELLASLSDDDMQEVLKIENRLHRRKVKREIVRLCSVADYSNLDVDGVGQWLCDVGREMARYRGAFIDSGVSIPMLYHLTAEDLETTIGIRNALHRKKLLLAIEEQFGYVSARLPTDSMDAPPSLSAMQRPSIFASVDMADAVMTSVPVSSPTPQKPVDVFISYRRSNGSQLASLLKVHLRLKFRNLNVFLDVDELGAGKFDEALLDFIAQAKNFILVLSPNALDRCFGDVFVQDWVHKEVQTAVQAKSNIIPVLDEKFEWPASEKLPEDIRAVMKFNGVSWSHMYQEAAVEKIVNFLDVPGKAAAPAYHHHLSPDDLSPKAELGASRSGQLPVVELHGSHYSLPGARSPKPSRGTLSAAVATDDDVAGGGVRAQRSLSATFALGRSAANGSPHGHRPFVRPMSTVERPRERL